jgi:hypothetical protein
MLSEETRLGARVRIREEYRKPELRGLLGTVQQKWGNPDYHTAVLVRLEDGRYELFWHHELEETDGKPPGRSWRDALW